MDIELILQNWSLFLQGIWTTLWLVATALLIGGLMAIPLALAQALKIRFWGQLAFGFSYAFRGTPLLVQMYLIYYGLSQFEAVRDSVFWFVLKDAALCALISFSLNSAAYTSEILRGAMVAIPKGISEAAQALGLKRWQALMLVIVPLALRRSIPAYSNEVIFMLHASVIASTITVVDILGAGRQINADYYLVYEGFLAAAVIYMTLVLIISLIFRQLERRFLAFNQPFRASAKRAVA